MTEVLWKVGRGKYSEVFSVFRCSGSTARCLGFYQVFEVFGNLTDGSNRLRWRFSLWICSLIVELQFGDFADTRSNKVSGSKRGFGELVDNDDSIFGNKKEGRGLLTCA
ncbi:hypothetical protein Droror1_Dr00020312 [Drosera rotundifolia]